MWILEGLCPYPHFVQGSTVNAGKKNPKEHSRWKEIIVRVNISHVIKERPKTEGSGRSSC